MGTTLSASHSDIKGILWMVHYGIWFSILGITIRYLSLEPFNLHPFQIVFFRTAIALVCVLPWSCLSNLFSLSRTQHIMLGGRTFLSFIATLCWFYALTAMAITDAVALSFTTPLFTTLTAILFLKEKVYIRRWSALIIGFIGILIILRPGSTIFDYDSFFVIITTCLWALANILTKKMSCTISLPTLLTYTSLLMLPLSLPLAWLFWEPIPTDAWLFLGFIGIMAAISDISLAQAFRHADVSIVMSFGFIRLIVTTILAWICFQEPLNIWTGIGSVIICASSIYIAHREHKKKQCTNK